ncbi:hypothetical protein [Kibdelosporangium phytohabitans]|uniref:Uncharacterized protein n=1 Tax=Kibdelosporangium phytohabitans TaxID=860235 RepID=A0A0N9HWU9_9PSEU|nr:hypothetical protein [Kibdelosporangium phytohabitans]ALG06546.1 hypothetical protein AOZ06_06045 [Kibdelosporangium phytohabitans]MBE1467731.1 hypothetical protein [Kibdelosporangium phytohabitans]
MRPLPAILAAVAAGVLTTVLTSWLMVMPLFWAIVVAIPVAAVTAMATMVAGVAAPMWSALPAPAESLTTHQVSSLSARLEEAAKDPSRFRNRVQPRLRRLAADTLRHRGVSLTDEHARHVLGDELHALITDRDARLPSPRRLAELLGRLEEK